MTDKINPIVVLVYASNEHDALGIFSPGGRKDGDTEGGSGLTKITRHNGELSYLISMPEHINDINIDIWQQDLDKMVHEHLKILLFLVGTTITTGHVLINRMPSRSWNPGHNLIMSPKLSYLTSPPVEPTDLSAGLSPLLSNFWPFNTNLFYNPRIIMNPDGTSFSTEIRQKDCDKYKQSITFSTDKTLEPMEIKPVPERTQELPVPIMVEDLLQHSPIIEIMKHEEPLVIPQAPELPPLHMPEMPALSLMELAPPSKPEVPTIPLFTDFKPINIPTAPELPSFVIPEITLTEESKPLPEILPINVVSASSLIEVAPPSKPEVPTIPLFADFKPINIPKAPELPSFVMPEITFIEESKPLPEISPINVTDLPQIQPCIASEEEEVKMEPIIESVLSASFSPTNAETEHLNIPTAPELPPLVLPKLPSPVYIEIIPSHSIATSKQPEEVEITSEFRPFNAPSSPGFIPLLPEPPFISSYIPVESPERKELDSNPEPKPVEIPAAPELPPLFLSDLEVPAPIEITSTINHLPTPEFVPLKVNIPVAPELPSFSRPEQLAVDDISNIVVESSASDSQPLRVNILAAPELPPLSLPELLTPIEFSPHKSEIEPSKDFPRVNIPTAPRLPPFSITEQPGPIKKLEEISPEIKPFKIGTLPQVPPLASDSIFFENGVPESSEEITKPTIIPQSPKIPLPEISKLPPIAPETPLIEEKPILVIENNPLPNLPELPPFKIHNTEPIIVKVPVNSQEPCKNGEEIPAFNSQGLQRPMMYPVFLAQNIIIERVVPNLYLSHKPYTRPMDSSDSAGSASHPVFSKDDVELEVY